MFLRQRPNPSNYLHGGPAQNYPSEGGPNVFEDFTRQHGQQLRTYEEAQLRLSIKPHRLPKLNSFHESPEQGSPRLRLGSQQKDQKDQSSAELLINTDNNQAMYPIATNQPNVPKLFTKISSPEANVRDSID